MRDLLTKDEAALAKSQGWCLEYVYEVVAVCAALGDQGQHPAGHEHNRHPGQTTRCPVSQGVATYSPTQFEIMSHNKCRDDTIEKRLLRHTLKTPSCWVWTGGKFTDGYGNIGTSKGARRAHRVSYELYVGPIPEGMQVLHSCDNPSCINPAHLSVGTCADNMRDRDTKGRHVPRPGVLNGAAKLNEADVRLIRISPLSTTELAGILEVCTHTIRRVRTNTSWSHV